MIFVKHSWQIISLFLAARRSSCNRFYSQFSSSYMVDACLEVLKVVFSIGNISQLTSVLLSFPRTTIVVLSMNPTHSCLEWWIGWTFELYLWTDSNSLKTIELEKKQQFSGFRLPRFVQICYQITLKDIIIMRHRPQLF